MSKIKNRFTKRQILTVHDNLLSDLYELNFDYFYEGHTLGFNYWGEETIIPLNSKHVKPNCRLNLIELYDEINGEPYLVHVSKGNNYKVGLRAKIPKDMLLVDGEMKKFSELSNIQQTDIFNQLKAKLYFSNTEILFTNILLDKFLNSDYDPKLSFKEIERLYRKKSIAYRNITINNLTYERYITTINGLCQKEIFLVTNDNFRGKRYGVNNRNISQKLLTVLSAYKHGSNNIVFAYSFGELGNILKLSRRYSSIISAASYTCKFSNTMSHAISYYIGQMIFIENYKIVKNPYKIYHEFEIDVADILKKVHYESRNNSDSGNSLDYKLNSYKYQPNKNRTNRMVLKYISSALAGAKLNKAIESYEVHYSYDETEKFSEKHEFDYDNDMNLNYEFSLNDVGNDVTATITVQLINNQS